MRWRSITLEYAVFWTTIAFSTSRRSIIRCARLFLRRSKAAMLSVHIWDAGSTGDLETAQASRKLLELIVSQTHRILSCELSSTSPEFWRYWIHPAPNLRRLVTKGQGPEIPPIFNEEIPRLETFTTHYYVPWPLGVYASLREVDLWNNNQTVTLLSLLDGLRGCKNLERLTLHGYTCLDRGGPPPATVSLPCLRQLDIFSSDSALILEHLDAPSLTGPVIIFDTNPHHHILSSLPRTQFNPPYLQGITKLHVVLNTRSAQHYVAGFREDGGTAFYFGACGIGHWLRWSWVRTSIEAVAACAHFFQIGSLVFATDTPDVPWDLWLPNLDCVGELTIACPQSEALLAALIVHPPPNESPLCPSLHSIALQRCGRYAAVDHAHLMSLVLSRYRAERPIRRIKLQKDEWDRIQQLNGSWRRLVRSQSTYVVFWGGTNLTDNRKGINGDIALLGLVSELGLEGVGEIF